MPVASTIKFRRPRYKHAKERYPSPTVNLALDGPHALLVGSYSVSCAHRFMFEHDERCTRTKTPFGEEGTKDRGRVLDATCLKWSTNVITTLCYVRPVRQLIGYSPLCNGYYKAQSPDGQYTRMAHHGAFYQVVTFVTAARLNKPLLVRY